MAVRRAEVYVPSQAFFILPKKFGINEIICFWQYKKKAPDAPLHYQDEATFFISNLVLLRPDNALG